MADNDILDEVTLELGAPVAFKGPSTYRALKRKPYGEWTLATLDGSPLPAQFYSLRPCPNLEVLKHEAGQILTKTDFSLMPRR